MSDPPRRRVAVPDEPDVRSERRSFFRIAAVLGVLVGIPLGVFGLPALLNVFFDEPTVPVGGSWSEDGVTIWVEEWYVDEGPEPALTVTLAVRSIEPWRFRGEGVALELSEGEPVPVEAVAAPDVFEDGRLGRIELRFPLGGANADGEAEPRAVRLTEPKARFELTESGH